MAFSWSRTSGVIYTGSHKKQEENGGFAHDDTNVMMLVSNPSLAASTVTSFVETTQVAPTILQALGVDPGRQGDAWHKQMQAHSRATNGVGAVTSEFPDNRHSSLPVMGS